MLSLELLGPIRARSDDVLLAVPAGKTRTLLALLLLQPGAGVDRERMVGELWGDMTPPSAAANLRTYLSKLRLWLADSTHDDGGQLLVQRRDGWQLAFRDVPVEVDVFAFEKHLERARGAVRAGDPHAASGHLRRAVALHRGAPMQDVPQGRVLAGRAGALTAKWLGAVEDHVAVLLELGQYETARVVLHEFLAGQPYRERAWGQLMVACGNSGDVQGALRAYATARRGLVDGLGVEPSAELTNLYQQILRGEPAVRLAAGATSAPRRIEPLCL
ncbi:AfsR/SARP family transcriptional regulator [Micromonospora sp. DR5-3]|uniref:AfsR/SARP family transcriptional regulator n=1 Tax=unclassified Micromonospora TaxID=2617518 RepID=UPI0011D695EF|nr:MULTISPECIES: AfsR/SARP family transcriptional regulator [unclassified Micromonospora]MCW3819711.1 AfsR/SARP family transcriptional regulator [Micromonospora sp. DR5-3]TYC19661.1 AfsR/SARP family transcriptional regulator [Micromonospora sp. MP36]